MTAKLSRASALLTVSLFTLQAAELSTSAYRVLGQRGFQQNGVNMVQGFELSAPAGLALDLRNGNARLYISDTGNHRILGYADVRSYQAGDPPALILGQANRQFSVPNGIGPGGLNGPLGLAVDPNTGNLYAADTGNSRILRFPDPFANPARVEPDAVYGQASFNSVAPQATRRNLNRPRALAFDSFGHLWVADSGNHRLVRFNAAVLDSITPPELDAVIGQPDFVSAFANSGAGAISASGFDIPTALVFDAQDNLYAADFNNARILRFPREPGSSNLSPAANAVWGQADLGTRGVPTQVTPTRLAGPVGLAVDSSGSVYVSVATDHRILVFPSAPSSTPNFVFGQRDFTSNRANAGAAPRASASTLSSPTSLAVDSEGNVYSADTGNNRVLMFPPRTPSASRVWGQLDYSANSPNQVKPASLNSPVKMAIDYSTPPYALYVADPNNHRVLGWRDASRFRDGDPADFVIGQPDLFTAHANLDTPNPNTPSQVSLASPAGLCVDSNDGTLYVADTGNNRVLRYPRPASQAGRITPDAVIGQIDFTTSTSASVTASTLNSPTGLALGPDGNLFVSDSGNNRVLEFAPRPGSNAAAIRVYGQPDFNTFSPPAEAGPQTLSNPRGLFVDPSGALYVADTGAHRIVLYPNTQAAPSAGAAAAIVIGQNSFTLSAASLLRTPTDVALDGDGNIYVADFSNNRILVFPPALFLPPNGATPASVIGQRDLRSTAPNWDSILGLASQAGLFGPYGIYLDRRDTLYIGDIGNNRVVHILKKAALANAATGQPGPLAPGAIVSLTGSALTAEPPSADPPSPWSQRAPGGWPMTASGRQVVINDEIAAPIFFFHPELVTFQLPQNTPLGTSRIAIRVAETGELVAGARTPVAASSPGIFTARDTAQAAATNEDGRANSSSNPAIRGTVLTLLGTGQGQVSPPVADGEAAPDAPLSKTVTVLTSDVRGCSGAQAMCVVMGNTFGEIQYSGLAPGFVGVWQVKVKIPQNAAPGSALPLRVIINGAPSNTVTVAIR